MLYLPEPDLTRYIKVERKLNRINIVAEIYLKNPLFKFEIDEKIKSFLEELGATK